LVTDEQPGRPIDSIPYSHQPADRETSGRNPWYRRVPFWRAVTGMAVALALGCAAVALEVAAELSASSTTYHHRLNLLGSRVSQMRAHIASIERQLSAARAENVTRTRMNHILSAPDAMILRLAPAGGSTARGLVAISRATSAAVLEVAGLPQPSEGSYVMWWMPIQGKPSKATEFRPDGEQRASIVAQLPPRGTKVAGIMVTMEGGKTIDQPAGPAILKGEFARPGAVS
jgi:anti-sigma-K factor RskA